MNTTDVQNRISKAVKDIDGRNLLRCPVCHSPVIEMTLKDAVIHQCSVCYWRKYTDLSDIRLNDV